MAKTLEQLLELDPIEPGDKETLHDLFITYGIAGILGALIEWGDTDTNPGFTAASIQSDLAALNRSNGTLDRTV